MAFQVLDVFEDKSSRPVMGDYLGCIEKQRSLGIAEETVGASQRILLGNACDRKWLARKACKQDVMLRYLSRILRELANVATDLVVVTIVQGVGFLAVWIPFGCEGAMTADAFETQTQATDTGKQVNETKLCRWFLCSMLRDFLERLDLKAAGLAFTVIVPSGRPQ
ncbi:hypothetical protein J3A65_004782 [Rhizobium sp. PvP014]|nr:hypothetical protein [Rhizobium sp. PvP014]